MLLRPVAFWLALLVSASPSVARQVSLPLRVDWEFFRRNLIEQVYTDPAGTARVWDDGTGCNYLELSDPQVTGSEGRLRIVTAGQARVGTAVGESCLTLVSWTGFLEIFEEPSLQSEVAAVTFRVVDSNIYDTDWRKRLATGTLWDWVKRYAHPRFQVLRLDLNRALADLRDMLSLVLAAEDRARMQGLLDSVTLAGVDVTAEHLAARVRFDLPDAPPRTPAAATEPTLTANELRRWERAWQQWDGFLTFVVKRVATDAAATDLLTELLAVLLEARYELLEAQAPSRPHAEDPVRRLFIATWRRLAPVVRRSSTGMPGETAMRYMSFVAAGDALQAIDDLGPETGLDISADGLRRLARIVAPEVPEDPLAYSVAVDPELRRLLGFPPPLPLPPRELGLLPPGWFASPAWALEGFDPAVLKRLNQWAPTVDDLDSYLPLVRDLLVHAGASAVEGGALQSQYHRLFRAIVLSTAWQETCWRQFVRTKGKLTTIRSKAGSIGLMQVNQSVWRGFYDVSALQRDIGYNAGAGSEILYRYLVDYALARGEHTKPGGVPNLARATYAAYNAGPRQLSRYRAAKASRRERQVDAAFWEKYQTVAAGNELAVAGCYGR